MKNRLVEVEMPDDSGEIIAITVTYYASDGLHSSFRIWPQYKREAFLTIKSIELALEDAKQKI